MMSATGLTISLLDILELISAKVKRLKRLKQIGSYYRKLLYNVAPTISFLNIPHLWETTPLPNHPLRDRHWRQSLHLFMLSITIVVYVLSCVPFSPIGRVFHYMKLMIVFAQFLCCPRARGLFHISEIVVIFMESSSAVVKNIFGLSNLV